jgi:hypothetical protein
MSEKSERKRRAYAVESNTWYPRTDQLQLPHVPDEARAKVREFLSTFIHRVRVGGGMCWEVAQSVMQIADSPRVAYVEGVWARAPQNPIEDDRTPAPHGWNTVDGHLVCLPSEFYTWGYPGDSMWLYEPFKVYEQDEYARVVALTSRTFGPKLTRELSLTTALVAIAMNNFELMVEDEVFASACERMQARHSELRLPKKAQTTEAEITKALNTASEMMPQFEELSATELVPPPVERGGTRMGQ